MRVATLRRPGSPAWRRHGSGFGLGVVGAVKPAKPGAGATLKAVIVGGGIGGLTAALAFLRVGWDVVVLEQAAELGDVGTGLQISPNGMKVLSALGLSDALRKVQFEPERLEMRLGRTGQYIFSIPLEGVAQTRWGASYLNFHRADLVGVLGAALEVRAPGALRLGAVVSGYEQSDDQVAAILADGSRIEGDVLVGADGLHSVVREQMHGVDRPRFTGNIAWRAVIPLDRLGDHAPPPNVCIWAGAGRHSVTYRVRGGDTVNFVGIVERDDTEMESWSHEGRKEDVLADFEGWHPVVRAVIEKADRHFCWALYDRAPLSQWADGQVALLGDAAHPMLPSMAQGAVMAIEDAWVLASLVGERKNIPTALEAYFGRRIDRTTRVQIRALANLRLFHQRTALRQTVAYGPIWLAGRLVPNFLHSRQDWIFGEEVTSVHDP
ncbi:MAG: FAD-dependent monooxygenase [Methyloligellaceae bacterium]